MDTTSHVRRAYPGEFTFRLLGIEKCKNLGRKLAGERGEQSSFKTKLVNGVDHQNILRFII
jgi:flagellar motor switch protein FliG